MAIHDSNNTQETQQPQQPAVQQTATQQPYAGAPVQQPQQQHQQQYAGQTFQDPNQMNQNHNQNQQGGFNDFASLFSMRLSPAQGSELITKAVEKLEEAIPIIIKGEEKHVDVGLMIIDRAVQRSLSHSVLVVTYTLKDQPKAPLAFHFIVLQGSGKEQEVEYRTINNENVEVRRLPSDAIDKRMRATVLQEVSSRVGQGRRCLDAEYSMMIKDFDIENEQHVFRLLVNAIMACRNVLMMSNPQWHDIKLSQLNNRGALNAVVSYHRTLNAHPLDDDALPYRNDVKIELRTPDANQSNGYTESTTLTTVEGFVDLNYSPVNGNAGMGLPGMPGMNTGPQYLPRFIMTNFDSDGARTLGTQAMSLATAILLYSNNDALAVLAPNTALPSDAVDLHDIGYLNYEAKVVTLADGTQGYVALKGADVSPQAISSYMAALIRPTFELGLDVSICGADTWVRSPYAAAARGNQGAINQIIASLNTLTDGHFGTIWNPTEYITRLDSRVILGRYQDSKGQWRDLRDIDYLAVMKRFADKNMPAVWEWTNARSNPNMSPEQSAYIQRRTIEMIVPNPEYTGYALRLTYNPKFLEAVSRSTQAAGLGIRLNAPNLSQMQQRYVYQPAGQYDSRAIVGGLAHSGISGMGSGMGYFGQQQGFGRW